MRPLTTAEQHRFGLPRGYVPIRSRGYSAKTAKAAFVPRRRAEAIIPALSRPSSYEHLARERAELSGGRNPMARYNSALRAFADKMGLTRGQARTDATFKNLYRKELRSKDRARKNAALLDLGLRRKDWWWREGETPTVLLFFGTADAAAAAPAAQRADYYTFALARKRST